MNYGKVLFQLYQLKQNEKKSAAQMKKLQERQLRSLLAYVWEHSPYYRRTFQEAGITEGQLAHLPLSSFPTIDKKELMEHFDELVTVPDVNQEELRNFDTEENQDRKTFRDYHVVHSSGSTGKPGYFIYDEKA